MNKRSAFLLFAFLFAASAFAQDPATGFPPYGSFDHGRFDTINRQNLNVNFALPIVSSPGRGQDFTFAIVYDSLIWKRNGSYWSPVVDESGNPTWGWKKDSGVGKIKYNWARELCDAPDGQHEWVTHYFSYEYEDVAGTLHSFEVDFYEFATVCQFPTGPRTGYATDGSGFYLDATSPTSAKVKPASGTEITGSKWTDTNGNYFSKIIVSSTETHWKDTLGRITLKVKKPTSTTTEYHVLDPTGGYQVTTLTLQTSNIKTNFACAAVIEYTGSASLPVSLSLPNGQSYSFTYEDTPNQAGYKTGRLKRVALPTGGYYEYTYPASPNNGIKCADGTVKDLTRIINDSTSSVTWRFIRTQDGTNGKTTVTAPLLAYDSAANQSTFTFSGAKEISQKYYQGSEAPANLLRTIDTTWAANGSPASQTTILADTSQQAKVETVFDDYGNLTQLKEYDWGSSAPGPLVRTTTLTYLSTSPYTGRNIRNRVTQVIVREGGPTGPIKSRTDITYDEATYSNSPCVTGAAQHNDSAYGCSFTYRGNPTTVTTYTDPAAQSGAIARHSTYDSLGNLRQADVNCCQQKQWTYSATTQYAYPDSVTDGPAGTQLTTNFAYNFNTGLLSSSTDPNSKTTSFAYDNLKRLTTVTRPDNAQITYSYDDVNRTVTVDTPVQGTDKIRQRTDFDGLGRPVKQTLQDAASATYSIVETQYDALGRAYKVSNPHNSTAQYWTETRFDAIGRPVAVHKVDAIGAITSGHTTTYSYSGNAATVTDPTGKQRKSETDGLGRLVKVYEPDVNSGNQLTQLTTNTYDVRDLLTQVSHGVQSRTYNYDGLGRLTSQTTPEAGTVSHTYNSFSLVTSRTDYRGVNTSYSYDTLNRLTQVSYNTSGTTAVATPTVSFTYGTDPNLNNKGRLTQMSDGTGSESYTYDVLGRITQVTKTIDSVNYVIGYAYNLASELTSITYPSGRVLTQTYDPIGRLSQIASGGTSYIANLQYNAAQQPTAFNYGNGVAASLGYSAARLLLESLSYTKAGQTLFGLSYGYSDANANNNGQIQSITDNVDSTRSATYAYDALGRLKEAAITGSPTSKWHYLYTYDRYGNLTDKTLQPDSLGSHPTLSITVNAATNRITSAGFSYDGSGNLTNDAQYAYTYDAENRAVTGAGATYSYDGASLRVKKVAGSTTTRYIFSGTKVIAEYLNGSLSREYIYSGNGLLATIEGSTTTYHHADHLSVRVATDTAGNAVRTYGHYPFGETWYETGTADKWKFTSYERDAESALDYAIFRYDSSRLGRFITADPMAGSVAAPQSLNRYAYVQNDAVNLIDPLGLICTQVCTGSTCGPVVCTDDSVPTVPLSLALANIGDALFRLIGRGSFFIYPLDPPGEAPEVDPAPGGPGGPGNGGGNAKLGFTDCVLLVADQATYGLHGAVVAAAGATLAAWRLTDLRMPGLGGSVPAPAGVGFLAGAVASGLGASGYGALKVGMFVEEGILGAARAAPYVLAAEAGILLGSAIVCRE